MCVFIHDVADRRDARRAARGETKNKKKAAPFEPPLAASSSSSFGSRRLRRYRLRRFVERDVEKVFGYSLSVSDCRAFREAKRFTRVFSHKREKPRDSQNVSSRRRRRFGVCVTKEGVSAPDRSLEKSANAFLMSDDVRRREERDSRRARKPKPKPKGKETPNRRRFAPASVRANTLESTE